MQNPGIICQLCKLKAAVPKKKPENCSTSLVPKKFKIQVAKFLFGFHTLPPLLSHSGDGNNH
jgi:hypothetical protein